MYQRNLTLGASEMGSMVTLIALACGMVQSADEIRKVHVPRIAENDHEVAAWFALMKALTPHLKDTNESVARWRKQHGQGYRLLVAWDRDTPLALAGFRHQENLLHGLHRYVDHLVTVEHARSWNLDKGIMDRLKRETAARALVGWYLMLLSAML